MSSTSPSFPSPRAVRSQSPSAISTSRTPGTRSEASCSYDSFCSSLPLPLSCRSLAAVRSPLHVELSPHTALQLTQTPLLTAATIQGPQNIILGGKTIIQPHSIIRGDLRRSGAGSKPSVVISLGRYCLIGEGCVIRPPGKCYRGLVHRRRRSVGGARTLKERKREGRRRELAS